MAQVSSISNEQSPTAKSITLKISRYNPEHDESSQFMEFNVQYEKWTTVLEAILDTVSTRIGLSLMYWIDTCDLLSGRRKFKSPLLRTSARRLVSLCAKVIGIGINSGVSLQA